LDFALQECGEFWLEYALFTNTWFAVKKICCLLMLFSEVRSEWWSREVLVGWIKISSNQTNSKSNFSPNQIVGGTVEIYLYKLFKYVLNGCIYESQPVSKM